MHVAEICWDDGVTRHEGSKGRHGLPWIMVFMLIESDTSLSSWIFNIWVLQIIKRRLRNLWGWSNMHSCLSGPQSGWYRRWSSTHWNDLTWHTKWEVMAVVNSAPGNALSIWWCTQHPGERPWCFGSHVLKIRTEGLHTMNHHHCQSSCWLWEHCVRHSEYPLWRFWWLAIHHLKLLEECQEAFLFGFPGSLPFGVPGSILFGVHGTWGALLRSLPFTTCMQKSKQLLAVLSLRQSVELVQAIISSVISCAVIGGGGAVLEIPIATWQPCLSELFRSLDLVPLLDAISY